MITRSFTALHLSLKISSLQTNLFKGLVWGQSNTRKTWGNERTLLPRWDLNNSLLLQQAFYLICGTSGTTLKMCWSQILQASCIRCSFGCSLMLHLAELLTLKSYTLVVHINAVIYHCSLCCGYSTVRSFCLVWKRHVFTGFVYTASGTFYPLLRLWPHTHWSL